MSQYYGTVDGCAPTVASRRGSKGSGIRTIAASWDGAVEVQIHWDEQRQQHYCSIVQIPWHGEGHTLEIYRGPFPVGTEQNEIKEETSDE